MIYLSTFSVASLDSFSSIAKMQVVIIAADELREKYS